MNRTVLWRTFPIAARAECRKFIKAILRKGDTLNDQRFEVLFKEIDKDNSNTIDKSEMVAFLQTLYADKGDPDLAQEDEEENANHI